MELEELKKQIESNEALMVYFSGETCSVCKALMPKVKKVFSESFPKIKQIYIQSEKFKQTSAQFEVLTLPTIIVFFDNKKFIKQSRHISIDELKNQIQRPYKVFFN